MRPEDVTFKLKIGRQCEQKFAELEPVFTLHTAAVCWDDAEQLVMINRLGQMYADVYLAPCQAAWADKTKHYFPGKGTAMPLPRVHEHYDHVANPEEFLDLAKVYEFEKPKIYKINFTRHGYYPIVVLSMRDDLAGAIEEAAAFAKEKGYNGYFMNEEAVQEAIAEETIDENIYTESGYIDGEEISAEWYEKGHWMRA